MLDRVNIKTLVFVFAASLLIVILAPSFISRGKNALPAVVSTSGVAGGPPPALKFLFNEEILGGAEIKQNQIKRMSDGSEKYTFSYFSDKKASETYAYFKNYFEESNFSISFDSISPFASPNKFFLSAKSRDGIVYDVFTEQKEPKLSWISINARAGTK